MTGVPAISVITPCYNAAGTIRATIESVRAQSYPNWEMIIADDCSTDQSLLILQEEAAGDRRIHPLAAEKNGGAAHARNRALHQARGRYVAFLDSDDRWKPEKLEKQLAFMKEGGYAFSFTGYEYIARDGKLLGKQVAAPRTVCYRDMLKNTIVGCLTVMIDREKTGPFQMPDLRSRQDLATWLTLLRRGMVAHGLDEPLAEYRLSGARSLSGNKWEAARKTWQVYRKVEHISLPRSLWYFSHYAVNALIKRF
ncbi:MAG: glycosyltransferase family 2 protein [Sporolactobacillus sp.]